MTVVDELDVQEQREKLRAASREQAESIVRLAGFEVRRVWELANDYWPASPRYDEVRRPWWLFLTDIGPVRIGWRKHVLEIEWDACAARGVVTEDDVTKGPAHVHAWSVENAITYLRELRRLALKGPADGR